MASMPGTELMDSDEDLESQPFPTTFALSCGVLPLSLSLSFLGGCLSSGEDPLAGDQNDHDMDSIAGVLKLYFRGLEHPLFPKDIFHDLMACVSKYILASDWLLGKKEHLVAIDEQFPRDLLSPHKLFNNVSLFPFPQ